jgi:TDG/mug DNA glycosylase family protein
LRAEDTAATLPDILSTGLSAVFCGINPGLRAATSGHHFAGRSNRFWRALHLAGFTPHEIRPEDDREILKYRCGLTTVVARATVSADQVAKHEFVAAAKGFERKIRRYAPRHVAFLGKVAYAALTRQRTIDWGLQPELFGGATAWVLPNPSGLNRAFLLADLVAAYRKLRIAAERAALAKNP